MDDNIIEKIVGMISAAGMARTKYMEAIAASKSADFEKAADLMKEGEECFIQAHHAHSDLLADEATTIEGAGEQSNVSLILVHAEDQMMAAETFRLLSEEFIDVHKELNNLRK